MTNQPQQTLPALLAETKHALAQRLITREDAVRRLTEAFDITEVGAEDLLDNGITVWAGHGSGKSTAPGALFTSLVSGSSPEFRDIHDAGSW